MTRIVGGRLSGRRIITPPGNATRPTAEKVRAAIANALHAVGGIDGAAVLDLYAGSGALGIELASRGARRVVLVERHRAAQTAIRASLDALGTPEVHLHPGDVLTYASAPGEVFDIVLADPPYDTDDDALRAVLEALVAAGRLAPHADIVIERSARRGEFAWPEPLVAARSKRYGDTMISYGTAP